MAVLFTDRELEKGVLWERGPSIVAEVREGRAAYTTVLAVLRTVEARRHVGHQEDGKAHRNRALVERGRAMTGWALAGPSSPTFRRGVDIRLTRPQECTRSGCTAHGVPPKRRRELAARRSAR